MKNNLDPQEHLVSISKYLSFILRHKPQSIGLALDEQGWANLDDLISKTSKFNLTLELLRIVVELNDKQRFAFNEDLTKIRANQGHTVSIDLALNPLTPPPILLHGTAERFIPSIRQHGLQKQKRHHVHLSDNLDVAKAVGQRYGKPVVLKVDADLMHKNGFSFFRTANNVWLVDHVPAEYIE